MGAVKIVSLLPSATEIVYFLGLGDDLEGVTHECDFPPEARSKPIVSTTSLPLEEGTSAAEIDKLVGEKMAAGQPLYRVDEQLVSKIQPDLILAQDLCHVCAVPSGQVTDALAKLGCESEVISLDPLSVGAVLEGIERVARFAGSNVEPIEELRGRVGVVKERSSGLNRIPTLALEWSEPPFIGGHWVPEMVTMAGGRDVLGKAGRRSQRVEWAAIAAAGPETAVFMPCGYGLDDAIAQARALYEIESFAATPAARRGLLFAVDASAYFSRPGPRLVEGIETLAWILHPEAFPRPPDGRVARVAP